MVEGEIGSVEVQSSQFVVLEYPNEELEACRFGSEVDAMDDVTPVCASEDVIDDMASRMTGYRKVVVVEEEGCIPDARSQILAELMLHMRLLRYSLVSTSNSTQTHPNREGKYSSLVLIVFRCLVMAHDAIALCVGSPCKVLQPRQPITINNRYGNLPHLYPSRPTLKAF
jgi:hypothetical protein